MSTPQAQLPDWLLRLQKDPYEVARDAAGTGTRVVGYVGDTVPVALILAAGALPLRLRGIAGSGASRASSFIESSFSAEIVAIADQWLEGSLDFLDSVVLSRNDDSGQRLYYYLCELQRRGMVRGPRPLLFDVANLSRSASREHTENSARLLAADLRTSASELARSLERVAKREALLRDLDARRVAASPLAASAAWLLEFAAHADWRETFEPRALEWLAQASTINAPRRILLAGSPLPGNQMHLAIETCGASVVLELTGSATSSDPAERDPFAAIAGQAQRRESPALAMRRDARWIAQRAIDHRIDAAILWLGEQDEALPWEAVRQMRSLREAGIPAVMLARQPWHVPAAMLSQVMEFVRIPGTPK